VPSFRDRDREGPRYDQSYLSPVFLDADAAARAHAAEAWLRGHVLDRI